MRPITRARNVDLIVIGAGVIGSACAFRLAQAGREVILLDADDVGMGASFGNAGHIATEQVFPLASNRPLRLRVAYLLPILPWLARFVWAARTPSFARGVAALLALQQSARADMAQLLQDAAVGHLLHLNGHLEVWESAAGRASALSQARLLRPHGVESLPLSASALAESIGGLGRQVQGAVHYPDSAHVDDPHAVCTGLALALLRHGGRISQGRAERLDGFSTLGARPPAGAGRGAPPCPCVLCLWPPASGADPGRRHGARHDGSGAGAARSD